MSLLSAIATTGRDEWDVLSNVFVSAGYGFALAAFQYRFRWVVPLILLHAAADFTTILSDARSETSRAPARSSPSSSWASSSCAPYRPSDRRDSRSRSESASY